MIGENEDTPPRGTSADVVGIHKISSEIQEDPQVKAIRKMFVEASETLRERIKKDLTEAIDEATKKLAPRWVVKAIFYMIAAQVVIAAGLVYTLLR